MINLTEEQVFVRRDILNHYGQKQILDCKAHGITGITVFQFLKITEREGWKSILPSIKEPAFTIYFQTGFDIKKKQPSMNVGIIIHDYIQYGLELAKLTSIIKIHYHTAEIGPAKDVPAGVYSE